MKTYDVDSFLSARASGNATTAAQPAQAHGKDSIKAKGATDPNDKAQNRLDNQTRQLANLKSKLGHNSLWPGARGQRQNKGDGTAESRKGKGKGKNGKGKGTTKTKGKVKGKGRTSAVPRSLRRGNANDSYGNPLCFAFNLGNCPTKG